MWKYRTALILLIFTSLFSAPKESWELVEKINLGGNVRREELLFADSLVYGASVEDRQFFCINLYENREIFRKPMNFTKGMSKPNKRWDLFYHEIHGDTISRIFYGNKRVHLHQSTVHGEEILSKQFFPVDGYIKDAALFNDTLAVNFYTSGQRGTEKTSGIILIDYTTGKRIHFIRVFSDRTGKMGKLIHLTDSSLIFNTEVKDTVTDRVTNGHVALRRSNGEILWQVSNRICGENELLLNDSTLLISNYGSRLYKLNTADGTIDSSIIESGKILHNSPRFITNDSVLLWRGQLKRLNSKMELIDESDSSYLARAVTQNNSYIAVVSRRRVYLLNRHDFSLSDSVSFYNGNDSDTFSPVLTPDNDLFTLEYNTFQSYLHHYRPYREGKLDLRTLSADTYLYYNNGESFAKRGEIVSLPAKEHQLTLMGGNREAVICTLTVAPESTVSIPERFFQRRTLPRDSVDNRFDHIPVNHPLSEISRLTPHEIELDMGGGVFHDRYLVGTEKAFVFDLERNDTLWSIPNDALLKIFYNGKPHNRGSSRFKLRSIIPEERTIFASYDLRHETFLVWIDLDTGNFKKIKSVTNTNHIPGQSGSAFKYNQYYYNGLIWLYNRGIKAVHPQSGEIVYNYDVEPVKGGSFLGFYFMKDMLIYGKISPGFVEVIAIDPYSQKRVFTYTQQSPFHCKKPFIAEIVPKPENSGIYLILNNTLQDIDLRGKLIKSRELPKNANLSPPVISKTGLFFTVNYADRALAIDRKTLKTLWEFRATDASPHVVGGGEVIMETDNLDDTYYVCILDEKTGELQTRIRQKKMPFFRSIYRIYDNRLYAYRRYEKRLLVYDLNKFREN